MVLCVLERIVFEQREILFDRNLHVPCLLPLPRLDIIPPIRDISLYIVAHCEMSAFLPGFPSLMFLSKRICRVIDARRSSVDSIVLSSDSQGFHTRAPDARIDALPS